MPDVWVMICRRVTFSSRLRVTAPGRSDGSTLSTGVSGDIRPSSIRKSAIVVQMILLTEARSNHVSDFTSPTEAVYRVPLLLNTRHTALG